MKPLHAGLYGLAVTGALLDDGNEDVEERYRRIQAEQEAKISALSSDWWPA